MKPWKVLYTSVLATICVVTIFQKKRGVFIEAFSELPQKILWKWESEHLPGQPPNVKTGMWLPQQDILAHPNIKLFITQWGMQSFQEAVYHGVPILGVPIFADQKYNAKKIATEEMGLQLPFKELTKQTLLTSITAILNDSKQVHGKYVDIMTDGLEKHIKSEGEMYRDNMKKMSAISKDEPQSSLSRAVWWTDYVIRHNGDKHLQSAALDLAWYQYLLLDVAAFLFILLAITVLVSYLILKNIYRYLTVHSYEVKSKHNKT